jgi:hypothetical protein
MDLPGENPLIRKCLGESERRDFRPLHSRFRIIGLEMYDGMKEVTIETNGRVVPGIDPNFWPTNGPTSYAAKRVLVWDFNNQHKEPYEKILRICWIQLNKCGW